MLFALGLLIGFCLGILWMALLYVAKGAGLPPNRPADTPTHEQDPSRSIHSQADPLSRPLLKD